MATSNVPKSGRESRGGWTRDGRRPGIYWRKNTSGSRSWGYYDRQLGRVSSIAGGRQQAIDAYEQAGQRKSRGMPAPDTRVRFQDLAEDVREVKRRRTRPSSFAAFEYALDKVILPEIGHLKPSQLSPDRVARLIRDLEDGKLTGTPLAPATIRRYLTVLSALIKLALRRGLTHLNPLAILGTDERPTGGGVRDHSEWSPADIDALIAGAERVARRPEARYDYSPLIRVLITLGLRVSEALALQVRDVDLLAGVLRIEHSLGRDGQLGQPKTRAGTREIPLAPGMVDLFARLIIDSADESDFVFSTTGQAPIAYWNFRRRGFVPALKEAGLAHRGITIHDLRSAAISLYAARGLTVVETAAVMGQSDPLVTWRHYLKLFDRSDVAARVRAAQESLLTTERGEDDL